jgi:hypothetical protein
LRPSLIIQSKESFCLTGEAGAGKTSLSRMIAREAIAQGLKCVYFPCSRIEERSADLIECLRKYLVSISAIQEGQEIGPLLSGVDLLIVDGCDESASFGTKKLAREIRSLLFLNQVRVEFQPEPNQDIFIPVDLEGVVKTQAVKAGKRRVVWVDEPVSDSEFDRLIGFEQNRDFRRCLRELQRRLSERRTQVVLTTRTTHPLSLPRNINVLSALPFDDDQLSRFFSSWFANDEGSYDRIMSMLASNEHVRTICKIPMIAALVASLQENNYDLPRSRTEIYANRFDLLLEKWDRMRQVPSRVRIRASDKMLLLSRLAFAIHRRNRSRFSVAELEAIWRRGIADLYPEVTADALVWELQCSNNVITPTGEGEYNFGHLSYQEYLAAKEIVNRQSPSFLVDKFDHAWWRQVLVFYAGISGNIDRLFTKLQSRRPIALRSSLVQEMSSEARYTSPALKAFLT